MKKSPRNRQSASRIRANVRRSALRIERLESRVVFAGDAPQAINDLFLTTQDEPLDVANAGVLANDLDAELDQLTAELFSNATHGSVTLQADGSFQYTPNAGYTGIDAFLYRATDGDSYSRLGAVTLRVNANELPPMAVADAYAIDEDSTLVIDASGVLANDSDADGDSLVANLVTGPQHGVVTLNADGSFVYTPEANFTGIDGFSYLANDGTLESDAANVTIDVQAVADAPVAVNDVYAIDEDTTLVIDASGVLANDSDADGDSLVANLVTGPQHGVVTLNADGSFSYTPDANFAGVDGFSYLATDGTLDSDAASVTIEVRDVIDEPVTRDDFYNVGEDDVLVVGIDRGVLANDVDPQGLPVAASLDAGPEHGSVILDADGSFRYQPAENYFGLDSFTYTATNGEGLSVSTRVNIVVQSINDTPTAAGDTYQLEADGSLAIGAESGILANDTDVEHDAIVPTIVEGPTHGTVVLGPDGSFLYAAKDGFRGPDSFRYQLNDGMSNSNVVVVTLNGGAVVAETSPEGESIPDESETVDAPLVVDDPLVIEDEDPFGPHDDDDGFGWKGLAHHHHHGRFNHCAHDWLFTDEHWRR